MKLILEKSSRRCILHYRSGSMHIRKRSFISYQSPKEHEMFSLKTTSAKKIQKNLTAGTLALALLAGSLAGATHIQENSRASAVSSTTSSSVSVSTTSQAGTLATSLPSSTNVATTSATSVDNGQQIGRLARTIINWAKSKGGSVWNSLKDSVRKGKRAVVNWVKTKLPRHLADAAIALGLESVAQWIINNWPW